MRTTVGLNVSMGGLDIEPWDLITLILGGASAVALFVQLSWGRTSFSLRWAVPLCWAVLVAAVASLAIALVRIVIIKSVGEDVVPQRISALTLAGLEPAPLLTARMPKRWSIQVAGSRIWSRAYHTCRRIALEGSQIPAVTAQQPDTAVPPRRPNRSGDDADSRRRSPRISEAQPTSTRYLYDEIGCRT